MGRTALPVHFLSFDNLKHMVESNRKLISSLQKLKKIMTFLELLKDTQKSLAKQFLL